MAATPEAKVKAKIKAYLKEKGVWFCQPVGSGYGTSGVPDILCCKDGKFIAIEVKAPGRRSNTSELQKMQIEVIKAAGGIAVVVDDVRQLEGVV